MVRSRFTLRALTKKDGYCCALGTFGEFLKGFWMLSGGPLREQHCQICFKGLRYHHSHSRKSIHPLPPPPTVGFISSRHSHAQGSLSCRWDMELLWFWIWDTLCQMGRQGWNELPWTNAALCIWICNVVICRESLCKECLNLDKSWVL